ncbi:MAG: phosphoglucosamine mutase [Alphaproteobacteria bacterium]|nr:phosphoglucosamine mutase [Alphaproteobacteria bacterium]
MTSRKYFGTDGIRGTANRFPMTADIAQRLGMAAGHYFTKGGHRHRVVIAKDTRLSGYMIENALTSGFLAMGMDVLLVGPMPTPAVAFLTRAMRADLGVMISASHNLYEDNGLKLFGPDGYKLSDAVELEIEAHMDDDLTRRFATPDKVGRAKRLDDAPGRYIEFVKSTFPKHLRLDGMKIVIDCANGAGYQVGPIILWELGAEVVPLHIAPNGTNINKACGSTHPESLAAAVLREGAHLGIALDGDADRLSVVDEKGMVRDGDQLMALMADYLHRHQLLRGDGIAATLMSNLGLERFLHTRGLQLYRTKVGDRYVMEAMREKGLNLGGEQSGHLILGDSSTTGDALVAALQVLAALIEDGRPASAALSMFAPVPQVLKNVRFTAGDPLAQGAVKDHIAQIESALGDAGRIVVRASGTEPLLRIMIEGEDKTAITTMADDLAAVITSSVAA